jgi:outer membrane protein assembly factor BamD
MRHKGYAAVVVLLLGAMALSVSGKTKLYDCTGNIQKAIEKYNKKRFSSAQGILTEVLAQCPGHSAYDTALYYQGKSLMAMKKPEEAKDEFERLVRTYPSCVFYEESYFRVGQCMLFSSNPVQLDQTSTKEAQTRLKEFMESFPNSVYADSARFCIGQIENKLAEKEFLTAQFYEKINQPEAAIVYYKLMNDDYPQSPLVPQAMLRCAEDLILANRTSEAAVVVEDLLRQGRDETITKKAQDLKEKLSKAK